MYFVRELFQGSVDGDENPNSRSVSRCSILGLVTLEEAVLTGLRKNSPRDILSQFQAYDRCSNTD